MHVPRAFLILLAAFLLAPPVAAHGGSTSETPRCALSSSDATAGCVTNVRYAWTHPACALVDGSYDCPIAYTATGLLVGEVCVHFGLAPADSLDATVQAPLACNGDVTAGLTPVTAADVSGTLTVRNLPREGGEVSWGVGMCLYAATSRTSAQPSPHPVTCTVTDARHVETIPPA